MCGAALILAPVGTCRAEGVQELQPIDVLSNSDENSVDNADAASEGHVSRERIEERPLLRPGELMEQVPGLITTQHSGDGKANQYFLRGFNLDHGTDFQTNLNGMPVNLPSHAHGQGYTDLNFLIPELVTSIDYTKGPYRAFQGDFATAGSAELRYADHLPTSFVEGTAGSFRYTRGLLAGSLPALNGSLLYGLELSHDDGPWDRRENYNKVNGVLRYTLSQEDRRLSVMLMGYQTSKWNATDQIPQRAIDQGLVSRYGSLDPNDGGQTHRYSESIELEGPLLGGRLKSALYGIQYYLDLNSDFTFFLNDPVHGDQIKQRDDRSILGWNGAWSRAGELAARSTVNTVGWDIRSDRIAPSGLYNTQQQQVLSTVLQDNVRETSLAVYGENETQWSGWLRSIAGLRLVRYDMDVSSNTPENSGRRHAGMGLPKLSLIFGPWARTAFYLNAGEGYHSNDARGATQTIATNPLDPAVGSPVSPVSPLVRAKGAEVGVRTELIPNLQSSLALWYLHLDSELVFDGDAGTTEAGRPSRRTGIEWSNRYAPLSWLTLEMNIAWSRARFTGDDPTGNVIPEALHTAGTAGVTVHDLGPWTGSLFVRYFGPRPLLADDSVRSASTTIFNAQATYRWSRHLSSRLEILNLLNSHADDITYYYASRLPGEPAQGFNDFMRHPVEPRAVRLSLRWAL